MAGFVRRFGPSDANRVESLASIEELDRYCYYVAGTVGHLLTNLFDLHPPGFSEARHRRLTTLATSFGIGLQLTNIVKDLADDRRRGWSFVPRQLCEAAGVDPAALDDPRHRDAARRVMDVLIDKASGHLEDALAYCTTIPRARYRIRLFCLTSLYFAVRTLRRARRDPRLLEPARKVKITRGEVYRTLATSCAIASSNTLVRTYFSVLSGKVAPVVSTRTPGRLPASTA